MSDPITGLNSALEGRYVIERKLGEGGMATVFLADDRKHDRLVALKVLNPEIAAVIGADRFLAEIKTTANLQHPNILPLYDSGEAGEFLYYVMPYVKGESLREHLDRRRQLPVADAVEIASDIAEALDYAHRQGVIHRDIKPANVLLGDGKPMVADFGIALALGAAGPGRLTETGLSLGTPIYMSPEQAVGEQTLTAATDVYSLGCVLYEMLVGEPPHTGGTTQAILGKIISGEVAGAAKHRPTVPTNVDAAIRKALEPVPADRFSRARDFASALSDPGFRHGRGSDSDSASRSGVWKRLSAVTVTTTLLLAIWVGGLLLRQDSPTPSMRVSVKAPGAQLYSGSLELSPDGSLLVYSAQDPGGEPSRLWVRRWNSLDATPVDGSAGAISPSISPDGKEIAFCSPGGVRVVSVLGGEPRSIAPRGSLAGTAWSDDGAWIYFADLFTGLKRVPAEGGPVEVLTEVDTARGDRGHADPQALPGDTGLLFAIVTADGIEIAVLDFGTGDVKRLGPGTSVRYSPTGHLLYIDETGTLLAVPFDVGSLEITGTAEPLVRGMAMANPPRGFLAVSGAGSLVYLAGGTGDHLTPVWVDRDGTAAEVDPDWMTTGLAASVALSPNADRLAISMQDSTGAYHLWVKGLDNGPLSRVTFEGSANRRATWSPDGIFLQFLSNRAGQADFWGTRADGSGVAEVLLDRDAPVSHALYSPDGSWLVFEEIGEESGRSEILAIRPSVDSIPIPIVVRPGFNAHAPALSPNGRWIAYSSDESGQEEVYVRPFPDADSGRWQVSTNGGTEPLWARGGRELFYRNGEGELVAVRVAESSSFAWTGQDVLFSAADYLSGNQHHPMYDVHPDGRRFVMLRSPKGGPWELILVQGFFEELKRLGPAGNQ